jgi:8-oxo-dGTP diphosphatase
MAAALTTRLVGLVYAGFGYLPTPAKHFVNRRINPRFLVGVIGVVVNARGEILLLRHTYRPRFPWGLPSGWLKRHESVRASLVREIKEETGYDVAFKRILDVENKERPTRLDIWLEYEYLGGDFRASNEVSDARWCGDELPADMLEVQRRFVERHRKRRV